MSINCLEQKKHDIRFNGAATLSLRKWAKSPLPIKKYLTSFNGAATLSLRKCRSSQQGSRGGPELQWGRNFIVAEISTTTKSVLGFVVASMGPQLYRCGNEPPKNSASSMHVMLQWGRNFIVAEMFPAPSGNVDEAPASMGPQLYRCGNKADKVEELRNILTLQWGRNFIVAEI